MLLDCGLFQGRRDEAERRNRDLGFDAKSVDAVLLSHAHIDDSGALPVLSKHGFFGKVFATRATTDLTDVMLADSAHIQESDCQYVNRKERRTDGRCRRPLPSSGPAGRHWRSAPSLRKWVAELVRVRTGGANRKIRVLTNSATTSASALALPAAGL